MLIWESRHLRTLLQWNLQNIREMPIHHHHPMASHDDIAPDGAFCLPSSEGRVPQKQPPNELRREEMKKAKGMKKGEAEAV